ncbi:hypothetical protein V501_05534, partial [Pseudogymnoascus sp. VKM F-4519 (FW-2642)]
MHLTNILLTVPPSLLLLSSYATTAHAHNNGAALPPPAHLPEPQVIQRRQEIAARIGAGMKPVRVRKMSEDGGEMFFGEYWGFEPQDEEEGDVLRREYDEDDDEISRVNSSAAFSFRPAFAIHEAESNTPRGLSEAQALHHRSSRALSALLKRAFQCPTGTTACTSISQPNYCCASTESCITITDTGLGPVGCCPSGQTCEGEITHYAGGGADDDVHAGYDDDDDDAEFDCGDDDGGAGAAGEGDGGEYYCCAAYHVPHLGLGSLSDGVLRLLGVLPWRGVLSRWSRLCADVLSDDGVGDG